MSSKIRFNLIYDCTEEDVTIDVDNAFPEVVGQKKAKEKIAFFLASWQADSDMAFPTLLLTGSHGLGKTYVAKKIAQKMSRRFCEVNGSMIDNEKDFFESFIFEQVHGRSPVTVFIDECHKIPKSVMTALLTVLNPTRNNKVVIAYNGVDIVFDMTKINFVFATTDAYQLLPPLKNRCEEVVFRPYSGDELIDMIRFYLGENIDIDCDTSDLVQACRGRGRDTFVLTQNIKRFWAAYSIDEEKLSSDMWEKLKSILGIGKQGLYEREIELVNLIAKHGPISANNLATMMMVNEDNVRQELEVRPRELGLIESTSRGRSVTEQGQRYIDNCVIPEGK